MPWIENLSPRATHSPHAEPRQNHEWYRITNLADDTAEILVYDDIGGWFGGGAEDFVRELRGISARRLNVRINSPGGSVFDGITIANAVRSHPADTTVYVDGIAASIASVIALAGDRLVMMPQSQIMIHDASGLAIGNAEEMRTMAELLDRQSDNIADAYADKAGGTPENWRALMRAETWYSAREAVDAGLADELQEMPPRRTDEDEPGEQKMRNTWDLSVFRYAGRDAAPAPAAAAAAPPAAPAAAPAAPAAPAAGAVARIELTINAADDPLVDILKAAMTPGLQAEPAPAEAQHEAPAEDEAPAEAAAEPPGTEPPAAPVDTGTETAWADIVAHLTQPTPDTSWADLTAHLTSPPLALSSSAATA